MAVVFLSVQGIHVFTVAGRWWTSDHTSRNKGKSESESLGGMDKPYILFECLNEPAAQKSYVFGLNSVNTSK